jgi:hypothetical protein
MRSAQRALLNIWLLMLLCTVLASLCLHDCMPYISCGCCTFCAVICHLKELLLLLLLSSCAGTMAALTGEWLAAADAAAHSAAGPRCIPAYSCAFTGLALAAQ